MLDSSKILSGWWTICSISISVLVGLTDQSTLCRLKSEVSYDEALRINENKLPETCEGKCYLACLMKENKALENGQVSTQVALNLIDEEKRMSVLQRRKLAFKMEKCAGSANLEQDECELAYKFTECVRGGKATDEEGSISSDDAEGGRTISIRLPEMINLMLPPLSLPPFNLVLFMLG